MKKLFSRVISIFAVFALISCGLISCSDIENNESGSVSFSISPDLAKAVLDTGRSLRAETDPTVVPSANESTSPYRIEVSLSGGRAETKRHSYTESEWQAIADKSESVKGKENVTSFTFDNIPVGTQIAISATIFYARDVQHDYPCMAGKSATLEIQQGDNPVSFNVHRLAMFNLECSSDEEITGISKLNVYALDSESEKASSLLEILKSADSSSESDAELFEKLEAEKSIYSYDDKPDLANLTGGFELKKGSTVNFFTLLYTENGVYLGYDSQMASTTVNTSGVASLSFILKKLDLTYTYIFPAKYADKTVSAWFVGGYVDEDADYEGKQPCIKTETSAVFLFSDKTFVITSHNTKKAISGDEIYRERIEYVMRGNYELSGDDFANGTFTLTPTAKYVEGRGWVALSEATQEQQKLVCEVTNGKFTPSSMEEPYEFSMKSDSDYLRVYRGKIDDTESGAIAGDEEEQSISAFLPKKFADRTVAAWYAYYGSDYTEAVFLFAEGEFVTTKHKYSQNSGEVREILAAGEYSLSGTPNDYDNNTGYAQFKEDDGTRSPAITITNGVMTVSEMSSNRYARQSLAALPTAQDETSGSGEPEPSSDFTNLAFFPSDYADKTVSAWYASEEVSTDKTKIYALYLFDDNTFVATKRKIQDSGETREIDQQGQYTFEGNADFENGEGVASVTEGGESKEYSFSIVDGTFSIAGVDTTYELQNGDLPEPSSATTPTPSIQVIIKFLFEDESGQYVEKEDFQSITAGSDYQATIPAYTARAYLLGYIMSDKTETMPTYDSEAKAYVLKIYYDLNSPAYLATGRGTPEDSSIQLAEEHQFTFTAYLDSTYDIKYSGGNDTDKVVSKGTWETSDSDETITITESAYYDFANSSDTLTDVQGSEDQTFSLAENSFNFKSANGIEIAFYFDGQEPESVTLDGGITVKLDSLSSEDLGEKISLSVEKAEDGKSVIITATPDKSVTVSQYNLILFEGQEQVSLPEGTLDSSTGYVWTLTEDVINKLSAGNHQITVSVIINDVLYTASTNLTITK